MHVPEIEDFEEDELKEADSLIGEEVQFLCVAMGHENESFDDFVKARDACQDELMYFPGRNTFGLASVAGNSDKLAALQNEFEIMKKRMDDEAKATKLENKIKLLTHGLQTRAGNLWSQIEATFKQMDTAATELECFQALQKQEVQAASYRVSSLVEEVNKQKGLERNLQQRYGDLIAEHERVQRLLDEHTERLQLEEEITAKQRALEEEIAAKQKAIEEEIAEKQQAHEEEIAAKSRSLMEKAMAKNYTVDEEMTDVCQWQDVSEAVACTPDLGMSKADLPISDPSPQLNVESSNVMYSAGQGQAAHSGDMVPEGLDHPREPTNAH